MNVRTLPVTHAASPTTNPCRLCAPLGASLAVRGIERAMPILHGSQGCATYIRRYLVSHFREPVDVASSSFGEQAAIFGGADNLMAALDNVAQRYRPSLIAVATTCLAETIGDDVKAILGQWHRRRGPEAPATIHVATPAYAGSHTEGFYATVLALVQQLAVAGPPSEQVNVLPPFGASPADLRALRKLLADFGLRAVLIPDWSETLDGGVWDDYHEIPPGGTPLQSLRETAAARATLTLYRLPRKSQASLGSLRGERGAASSVGRWLSERFGVRDCPVDVPLGVGATDALLSRLVELSGNDVPPAQLAERGRLVDAMVDAHKVLFERRVALVGEPELVLALARWCREVGLTPALCATGSDVGTLRSGLQELDGLECWVLEDSDHAEIAEVAADAAVELVIGPSKVRSWARKLGLPTVELGFPIHDRFGASRLRVLGYDGTLQLLDRVVNALLAFQQEKAGRGWSYQ